MIKIKREIRVCSAPGCDSSFECKINSERKFCCRGHNRKGKLSSSKQIEARRKAWIGKHHTKESKEKNRQGHLGITKETNLNLIRSEETKKRISESHKGIHISKVVKRKISDSQIKNWQNPEYLKNQMKARSTDKYKRKMRKSHRGQNNPMYGRIGDKNPNWKGGSSKLPYPFDFNKELKNLIRRRDNCTCQLCGKIQKRKEEKLSIHHIDYDKENLNPRNLITLCRGCNSKVNSNREIWINFFRLELRLRRAE